MSSNSFMKMFNALPFKGMQTSSKIEELMKSNRRLIHLIGNFSYSPRKDLLVLYFDDGEEVFVSSNCSSKKIYKVSRMGNVFNYSSDKELLDALWKVKVEKI